MAYGKIDLTAGDIAFLRSRLGRAAERIAASMTAASSTDERTFYERATVKIDQWIVSVSRYVAGPRRFDEDELLYLRGAIAETVPGALARRYVEAKRTGDASLDDLETEYEQWVTLSAKLEKPFLDDKSQDATEEEEGD
ncbi:hypothetical protein OIU34_21645 [Pararhizobium sp. BT-229]|uniref:hypothetical protein n=1 Tax=Pararhizobium sp. BT-229 TaxID=2986923 RepID=UPI0021F7DCED|nr:hypothetical protein [Pararhizobium sp. BT-229]MCV9964497.1 hypothetical protein [Pararhizobium sp. BT-229]